MDDPLDRIAAALDRLAPPPPADADPLAHPAYGWREGRLVAARSFAPLPLAMLVGIDRQRDAVADTLRRHALGHPAHDILLWGARGTGKSALAKSAVAAVQAEGRDLALVELGAPTAMPALFDHLAPVPRRFALFLDDLGIDLPAEARMLRSMLEGGAEARPDNVRLIVTSNRRHLQVREHAAEESAVNPRDALDDQLALSDRFGLSLGFHVLDQAGYLAIVEGYATRYGLAFDPGDAIRWATQRGSRSGRVAWHYVVELAGRAGRPLGSGEHPTP